MGVLNAKVGGTWAPVMEGAVGVFQEADEKAQPGGYASLDGTGKVPASQLPLLNQARTTTAKTTAFLAPTASESGTIALAAGYRLYAITCSAPCMVRLYTTTSKRDADAARPVGIDPAGDHGLQFEYLADSSTLAMALSPTVDGYDGKATPDGAIPVRIINTGTASTAITVSLLWIRCE